MSPRGPRPVARRITVRACAKLNLGLAVGPRRPDGFHELVTAMQTISLADTLVVEPRARGFTLSVGFEDASARRGEPAGPGQRRGGAGGVGAVSRTLRASPITVPRGADNLVLRAARRVAAAIGLRAGARFELTKRIPAGAGLGGGSADAAAVIAALPALYGVRLDHATRLRIAAAIGSDVPFALAGGTALARGRGERLTRLRLERPFQAIVAVPGWGVSTALAYARIDRHKYGLTARRLNLVSGQILGRKRLSAMALVRLGNTFEKVLGTRRSDFSSLCARLRSAGVIATRLTGSGSAVFGVLGPRVPAMQVVDRFAGNESLFVVRSTRGGSRLEWK